MSIKQMTLDDKFINQVLEFCERNNMTPEQLGNKASYLNRERIHEYFIIRKGSMRLSVCQRFVDQMKKIEPNLKVDIVFKRKP